MISLHASYSSQNMTVSMALDAPLSRSSTLFYEGFSQGSGKKTISVGASFMPIVVSRTVTTPVCVSLVDLSHI